MLETALITSQAQGLTTFVVAAGLLYGGGEDELANLFQANFSCYVGVPAGLNWLVFCLSFRFTGVVAL